MENETSKLFHIDWDGPFRLSELNALTDEEKDYGIYKIYGNHPVYGNSVLLYIGKADQQTIGKRVSQENWWDTNDSTIFKYTQAELQVIILHQKINGQKKLTWRRSS